MEALNTGEWWSGIVQSNVWLKPEEMKIGPVLWVLWFGRNFYIRLSAITALSVIESLEGQTCRRCVGLGRDGGQVFRMTLATRTANQWTQPNALRSADDRHRQSGCVSDPDRHYCSTPIPVTTWRMPACGQGGWTISVYNQPLWSTQFFISPE